LSDRPAGLEVLLVMTGGSASATLFDIGATVDVLHEGDTVGTLPLTLGCVRSERSAMRGTLPADWIRPGMRVRVTLDSGDPSVTVPSDPIEVEPLVATVPELQVTVFPLRVGDRAPSTSPAIYETWLDAATKRFAISTYDLEIHEPIDLGLGESCTSATKFPALRELSFLRTERASERFYVGVLPCSAGGVAYTPGFVQVTSPGVDRVETFLHELGHNFGLLHAPCGDPPGVDPNYPYQGGVLGLPGFDAATDTWLSAGTNDVMGYCAGSWLSDYSYARSARYRVTMERPPALSAQTEAPSDATLLVQGEVASDGTIDVTHAVRKAQPTRPQPPAASTDVDRVSIEIVAPSGQLLERHQATLLEVDHVDVRVFTTRIGMDEDAARRASTVRVAYGDERASRPIADGD
jgi:hypothetical protein